MAVQQATPRKSAPKQAALYRRLMASSQRPAQHVIDSTVEEKRTTATVKGCKAMENTMQAGISITEGTYFYLVASKFTHRFYVVVFDGKNWMSSATDKETQARTVAAVFSHRQRLSLNGRKAA